MRVREIMTKDVATATPDTTLEEIATMMKEEDVGSIPVVDEDDELAGIVTDRDIVIRCIAEGKDPTETTVDEILSEDLQTVEPNTNVEEAANIMSRQQIRRLPVVENGRLVGIVSLGDIAVKHGDEEVAGEALEDVSRGVKGGGRKPAAKVGREAKTQPADREARLRQQGGRGQTRTGARGRTSATTGGRGPEMAQRGRSGAHERTQGISNRRGAEEEGRQARVVPFRQEAKAAPSRRRKIS
jgi:CBS domain-containing protein